jgi:histidine triad (HIT) family protein
MNQQDAEQVKRQLLNNIESHFPKEKAEILKRQIMSMGDEQLEKFLEKSNQSNQPNECIFCSIASGNTESYKIGENDSSVAVLEINPISKGHVIIIPKEHLPVDSLPSEIKNFAKEIAQKIKDKLEPKDVEIAGLDIGGHGVINLIPVYKDENLKSKRYKADKSELDEVSGILKESAKESKKPEKKKVEKKPKPEKISQKSWLPKRIP